MYWSIDEYIVTRGSKGPNPVFPLGETGQYSLIQRSVTV